MGHALVAAVRRSLEQPAPLADRYLARLDRVLACLEQVAAGQPGEPLSSAIGAEEGDTLARRFLKPLEGSWDDGDENLVRGYLDRWVREGEDAGAATARSLLAAADALAGSGARAPTLWFYLWEMESVLESLAARSGPRRGGH
jgi:hypothetical protein